MSQLQVAMLMAGAVLIMGVIAYNRWLEWKAIKKLRAGLSRDGLDPLTSPSLREVTKGGRNEPRLTGFSVNDTTGSTLATRGFDEAMEQVVSISFDAPVAGDALLTACQGFVTAGAKPVELAATHAQSHQLELIRPDEFYSGLHFGVLLANRSGALTAIEYSDFVQGVQRVAEKFDVTIDVPDMDEVLTRAQKLDDQLAKIDLQMAIHVVTNGAAWSVEMIARAAVEAGFALRPDGRFVYFRSGTELFQMYVMDTEGRRVLALPGSSTQIQALSIIFDVPRAPEIEKPFQTLIAAARNIAARLGASVVDDHRNPVTEAAIMQVEAQLKPLYDRLHAMDVEAGSHRALRLFA
jgi:hypothetical protein